ncbi:DNA translocase FtsK [Tissierella creatinophila]|uniref:DNA translocase SpoIIIE n=1 Tax=Tissierella creatinophila DSM 6911 TaxID=1123403 RepID=A0A1U7M379_TISCR|nr:DNA translocase FtsK [Tissierella creatinophila]OLS01774.1 DNA translocase SpoIIIE [Tissierella creatinophila DSM 6911]
MKTKKRSKKGKKTEETRFNKDIIGLIIIAVGIISMISLFTFKVGLIGSIIRGTTFSMMGFGGYFMPLILIGLGIIIILDRFNKNEVKKTIIIFGLFLMFLVALDSQNISIIGFVNRIKTAIYLSNFNKGGGFIGSFIGFFFYKLFGLIGGFIILFFSTSVGLLILFDIKLKDLYQRTITMFSDFKKEKKDNKKLQALKKTNIKKEIQEENKISLNEEIQILDYNENHKKPNEIQKKVSKDIPLNYIDLEIKDGNNKTKSFIYEIPPIDLLESPDKQEFNDKKNILRNAEIIEDTMKNFGIDGKITQINKGPTITCYELSPSPGIKLSKIVSLSDNIALSLASSDIRIEAPIPGKSAVGIEVPNKIKDNVMLKEILLSKEYKEISSNTPIALGKDVSGKAVVSSIDKMPHLLIAGATGSGKSVCINTIIMSILYKSSPEDVKLLLIDPKVVELSIYNKIPHLLIPVVTDPKKASFSLNWAVEEMETRYKTFAENSVRDIHSYNEKSDSKELDKLPSIVIIIDELSDLMMVAAQEIEEYICRLAQMARAAGIYLIVATQRPSVDVITGTIKANIPSRISFAVSSQIDSRTILDMGGAEKLLGKGDMLFYPSFFSKPLRIQGAFISDNEVENIVSFLSKSHKISFDEEILEIMEKSKTIETIDNDSLLPDAVKLVVEEGQASISMLQRKLRIGYARAARIVDEMEEQGVIGGYEGSKPRKVLVVKDDIENMNIQ